MLSDANVRELEQAATRAAAPIAQSAADRAAREIAGGGPSAPGGGGGGGGGGGDAGGGRGGRRARAEPPAAASPAASSSGAQTAAAPVKAFIEPEKGENIECLFNPAELTIAKSNQWSEVKAPGRNTPKLTFSQGSPGTISMELTLDTTAT